MATSVFDWDGDGHMFADTVTEQETPTHSQLLGPNGKPLAYEPQKIKLGFDLRGRHS